ncbi:MAG: hypothetical protein ACTHKH_16470 [Trinickia sp.]|jgi:hypothetical protein
MTKQIAAQSLIATPILDAIQKLNPIATDEQRASLEQSLREIGQVNDIITAHDGAFVLAPQPIVDAQPHLVAHPVSPCASLAGLVSDGNRTL